MADIIHAPSSRISPNQSARPKGTKVTHVVLHHTGPGTFSGICDWLCNPVAKASAHYVVDLDGKIAQLVDPKRKAWHAGNSVINGKNNANDYSVGVEICNLGVLQKEGEDFFYEVGRDYRKYTGKTAPQKGTIIYPSGKVLEGWFAPYPPKQIMAVVNLCKKLMSEFPGINPSNITTHYAIALPEGRKNDPFGLDLDNIALLTSLDTTKLTSV